MQIFNIMSQSDLKSSHKNTIKQNIKDKDLKVQKKNTV